MSAANYPVLLSSNNIFNDILTLNRDRKKEPGDSSIYIFFYRYIGFYSEAEYFEKILGLNRELCKLEKQYILFKHKIDIPVNFEVIDKINSHSKDISLSQFNSGEFVRIFADMGIMNITDNSSLNEKFIFAFKEVIKLYALNEKVTNLSIAINFATKLLCWAREYLPVRFSSMMSLYNPKVVYYGDIKKHEAYFLILFSLMGCDVLFINSSNDEVFKAIDKDNRLSFCCEAPNRMKIKDIELLAAKNFTVAEATETSVGVKIATSKVIITASENIFEDILEPLSKRKNFIEDTLYPVYFQGCIGMVGSEEEYYNDLFNLDKKLKSLKSGYLKFENQIPMINNEESSRVLNEILKVSNLFDFNKKDSFIKRIMEFKCFPKFQEDARNISLRVAFRDTLTLYMDREKNINASKMQNFVIKLLAWTNRYFQLLFKEALKVDNPKVLYYGNIKAHEVYLLIFFSKIGCDVVYINSEDSSLKLIREIDLKEEYIFIKDFNSYKQLQAFPVIEKQVRRNTVAYNASQEIQQVIYGDGETGLFKPWQYEGGTTVPVGLKTTYQELKLLWKEPAKVRPEFKVQGNRVYVPNLFVKINGVFEGLEDYWADYKFFTEADNTFVIKSLPFTKVNYSRQELYGSAFLFNEKGLVDRDKLFKSPMYKFGYLKNSLQEFLVYKINELILANPFKGTFDEKLKLKILMTVLDLEGEALKLIEKFDFTSELPKIVVYSNSSESFSEEDIIFLAFFNIVGADIAVLTPTNYNNLELMLEGNMFDLHQLPAVAFDLQIPSIIIPSGQSVKSSVFKFFNFKGGNNK